MIRKSLSTVVNPAVARGRRSNLLRETQNPSESDFYSALLSDLAQKRLVLLTTEPNRRLDFRICISTPPRLNTYSSSSCSGMRDRTAKMWALALGLSWL